MPRQRRRGRAPRAPRPGAPRTRAARPRHRRRGARAPPRSTEAAPRGSSEFLRTERWPLGTKRPACALQGSGTQLAYAAGASERVEVERPQVNGGEIGDVELEIGFVACALDRRAHAVPPLVPRAERVVNVEDDGLVACIAPSS